jgi:hypothetical protein
MIFEAGSVVMLKSLSDLKEEFSWSKDKNGIYEFYHDNVAFYVNRSMAKLLDSEVIIKRISSGGHGFHTMDAYFWPYVTVKSVDSDFQLALKTIKIEIGL